jgi:BirA family transcriptional regulator, biotin operon repressor / biotin---[acetyl-CoA-carboxylase] ligase
MLTQADVHWIELDSVDSTNDYLGRAYLQGRVAGVTAVLAHHQTSGRGRAGRSWQAEQGSSLCLSIGIPAAGHQLPALPVCVGVGVAQVVAQMGIPIQLKWPNDLLVNNRKLGGVLCESFQTEQGPVTIIGLGMNIRTVSLAGSQQGLGVTSLAEWVGDQGLPGPRALAEDVLAAVLPVLDRAAHQGTAEVFAGFGKLDAWRGKPVQMIDHGKVLLTGVAMGLDSTGAYLLDTPQGLQSVMAGDVSLRVSE